jgi:hypothetical protein
MPPDFAPSTRRREAMPSRPDFAKPPMFELQRGAKSVRHSLLEYKRTGRRRTLLNSERADFFLSF